MIVAPAASLACEHEKLDPFGNVVRVVCSRLESLGHCDRLFRAEVSAPAAVCAAGTVVHDDPELLAEVPREDGPCRAVICAPAAADAFLMIPVGLSPEIFWNRRGRERIGESHHACF